MAFMKKKQQKFKDVEEVVKKFDGKVKNLLCKKSG